MEDVAFKIGHKKKIQNCLDNLNLRGIRFALSNVFAHKGQLNEQLIEWSKKYRVTHINNIYSNCNYHLKDRRAVTVEVLITNYEWKDEIIKE